jgi:SnoaL-like domain
VDFSTFHRLKESMMNAHTALIDRYFDAWNETDTGRRRELISATWANDAAYLDPLLSGNGHDGIDAMIHAVHERFPHHTFRRTTEVDGFANRLRFSWELLTPLGRFDREGLRLRRRRVGRPAAVRHRLSRRSARRSLTNSQQ